MFSSVMLYFCLLIFVILSGYTLGTFSTFVIYKMGRTMESIGYINNHFTYFFVTYFHSFIWIFLLATRNTRKLTSLLLNSLENSSFLHSLYTNCIDYLLIYQGYVLIQVNHHDHEELSELYLALQRHYKGCKEGCMLPGEPRSFQHVLDGIRMTGLHNVFNSSRKIQ